MNTNPQNPTNGHAMRTPASGDAEETLRLIASLPAPEGLEERVHRSLGAAPAVRRTLRRGQLLAWPAPPGAGRDLVRTAAAAAIAFVIAGGGWGVYRQVQPRRTANEIPFVSHGTKTGGLAPASAMRTPQTLHGPVVSGAVLVHPTAAHSAAKNEKKNAPVEHVNGKNGTARARTRANSGAQTAQP